MSDPDPLELVCYGQFLEGYSFVRFNLAVINIY